VRSPRWAPNKAASDPKLLDALKLAGILTGGGGKLGLVGLAGRSGMSVADVFSLLDQYRAQVFGKLSPAVMATINRDLQLIAAGRQPTGLQAGGIVSAGAARSGMFYRWAEPGSGGESLIPHGGQYRGRALALWSETGRRLGVQGGGGSTTVLTVAPGAVQVNLTVPGSNLSADQVRAAATDAATAAVSKLRRVLVQTTGGRG
jgi:hypothetical protein